MSLTTNVRNSKNKFIHKKMDKFGTVNKSM